MAALARRKTVWDVLNTPLPELPYRNQRLSTQGKGSTQWAACSHTPARIEKWTGFPACVANEGAKSENQQPCGVDLSAKFLALSLKTITEEEHVTQNTTLVLEQLAASVLVDQTFDSTSKYTDAFPNIICQQKLDSHKTGTFDEYESPGKGKTKRAANLKQAEECRPVRV